MEISSNKSSDPVTGITISQLFIFLGTTDRNYCPAISQLLLWYIMILFLFLSLNAHLGKSPTPMIFLSLKNYLDWKLGPPLPLKWILCLQGMPLRWEKGRKNQTRALPDPADIKRQIKDIKKHMHSRKYLYKWTTRISPHTQISVKTQKYIIHYNNLSTFLKVNN